MHQLCEQWKDDVFVVAEKNELYKLKDIMESKNDTSGKENTIRWQEIANAEIKTNL